MPKGKLRLLITEACNRNCKLCCNKQYNLAKLHVESNFAQYSEIILTGGEPMLDVNYLINVIEHIKAKTGVNTKLWLQTAKVDDLYGILCTLDLINGVTVTLHDNTDIPAFKIFDYQLYCGEPRWKNKSFRICIFDNVELPELHMPWKVKNIVWETDCPLPEGEVFKRFAFID